MLTRSKAQAKKKEEDVAMALAKSELRTKKRNDRKKKQMAAAVESKATASNSGQVIYSLTEVFPDYRNGGNRVMFSLFRDKKQAFASKNKFLAGWDYFTRPRDEDDDQDDDDDDDDDNEEEDDDEEEVQNNQDKAAASVDEDDEDEEDNVSEKVKEQKKGQDAEWMKKRRIRDKKAWANACEVRGEDGDGIFARIEEVDLTRSGDGEGCFYFTYANA